MKKSRQANILVTGAHRSGTTWVGRTIAFHDSIKYISEPFNVSHPNQNVNLTFRTWFTHVPTSVQFGEIKNAFDNLLTPNISTLLTLLFYNRKNCIQNILQSTKINVLQYFNKLRILIKDPIAIFSAGWLYRRYGLKVVCLIRNPFGFIGSLKKANWNYYFSDLFEQEVFLKERLYEYYPEIKKYAENPSDLIDHGCLLWNLFHSAILEYQNRYPSWLFVKHEELAADPVNAFRKVFSYLDLHMDERINTQIEEYTSSKNKGEANTTSFRPRDARQTITAWKNRLTPNEIDRVRLATNRVATQLYQIPDEFE